MTRPTGEDEMSNETEAAAMTDPKLLPLPEGVDVIFSPDGNGAALDVFTAEQMQDYARANVAHHTAELQAEIEALRAEVEDYRTNGAAAVRFAPNSAYWSNELRRLFGDDARTGIEVLESQYRQELTRAERLAEAIKAYKSECDNPAKDYVLRAKRRDEMFALLRDHDQEVGNG